MRARSNGGFPRAALVGLIAVLAVFGSVLTACGGGGSDKSDEPAEGAKPQPGGTVSYGLSLDIDGLNPVTNQWNSSNINVGKAIYDPMVVLNPEGVAEPYLVESFEPNDDFTEWTITTRDGIKWHNGEPLTPYDIATHLKNIQLGLLTGFGFKSVTAVGVVDEVAKPAFEAGEISQEEYDVQRRQVKVFTDEPWSTFPSFLAALQNAYVAYPAYEAGEIEDPIGTGPFKLDEFIRSDRITVSRNDDYWREGLPYLDEIEFKIMLDPQTRSQALQSGDVDMINTEAYGQVVDFANDEQMKKDYQYIADSSDGDEANVILNTQTGPTADLDVRKALQLATDQAAINDQLYGGYFETADAPYRADSKWYRDPGWPEPDMDEAKQLVEEWEADNGPLEITFKVLSDADNLELGQALAAQWTEAGVDVEVTSVDASVAGTTLAGGDFDAFMWIFFFGADPDEHYPMWDPDEENIGGPGEISINMPRYTSDAVKDAMHGGRQTDDFEERADLYGDLWADFAENVPFLWVIHVDWLVVAEKNIHGLEEFTTPEGKPAAGHVWGTVFFTEAWVTQ
jgi:ABC-type transport system substrate-binding protein